MAATEQSTQAARRWMRPFSIAAFGASAALILAATPWLRPAPSLPDPAPTLSEALAIFDQGTNPEAERIGSWPGDIQICLIRGPGAGAAPDRFAELIRDLANQMRLPLRPYLADRAVNCDRQETSIFAFIGQNPGDRRLRHIMAYALNTSIGPQDSDLGQIPGFTHMLSPVSAGPEPRPKTFLYTASDEPADPDAPPSIQVQATFLRELLRALTSVQDAKTPRLMTILDTSMAAETEASPQTDDPDQTLAAYCTLDFLWLDLLVRPSRPGGDPTALRQALMANYGTLLTRAARHRAALPHLADDRC